MDEESLDTVDRFLKSLIFGFICFEVSKQLLAKIVALAESTKPEYAACACYAIQKMEEIAYDDAAKYKTLYLLLQQNSSDTIINNYKTTEGPYDVDTMITVMDLYILSKLPSYYELVKRVKRHKLDVSTKEEYIASVLKQIKQFIKNDQDSVYVAIAKFLYPANCSYITVYCNWKRDE